MTTFNDTHLSGEARSRFIDDFLASGKVSRYPVDPAVSFDENQGATYTGISLADLTEEIERAYELFPGQWELAGVVATALLNTVHSDELCVLAKLPASKLDVDLLLAHLEAMGWGFSPALSASIARRAMLVLLNNGGNIRTQSTMQRERPQQLVDGRWRIGSYQEFGRDRPAVIVMGRQSEVGRYDDGSSRGVGHEGSDGGGGKRQGSECGGASHEGSLEDGGAPDLSGGGRGHARGKLIIQEDLCFGNDEIPKGSEFDWLVPTPYERRQLEEDYQADKERVGTRARPWVIIEFRGKRRRIPGSVVKRL